MLDIVSCAIFLQKLEILFVQVCSGNGSSCISHKSNLLDDVVREKILVSASYIILSKWVITTVLCPPPKKTKPSQLYFSVTLKVVWKISIVV